MCVWVLIVARLFDFPVPSPAFTKALKVNAMLVNKVELVRAADAEVTGVPWRVIVDGFTAFFEAESDARAFYDLWVGRIENAK